MADYNRVKIGSVYLTDTGLVDGLPCRVEVQGLQFLQTAKKGAIVKSANGTPYKFLIDNTGEGVELRFQIMVINTTTLDALKTVIDTAEAGALTVNTTIEGDLGDFDLECIPGQVPLEPSGRFSDGRIFDVAVNLVISSMN